MGFSMGASPLLSPQQSGGWNTVPQNALDLMSKTQGVQRQGIQNKYLPPELAAMVQQQQQKALQMQAQTPYSGPQAAANVQQTQLSNKWYPATQNAQIQNTLASAGFTTQKMNMLPAEVRNQLIQIAATHPGKFLALSNKLLPGSDAAYGLFNSQISGLTNPQKVNIPGQGSTPFGNTNGMISGAKQSIPSQQPGPEIYGKSNAERDMGNAPSSVFPLDPKYNKILGSLNLPAAQIRAARLGETVKLSDGRLMKIENGKIYFGK